MSITIGVKSGGSSSSHVLTMITFFARVLHLWPFDCTTVMDTCLYIFPIFISLTVPDLPACTPPMTLHFAPSITAET